MSNEQLIALYFDWIKDVIKEGLIEEASLVLTSIIDIANTMGLKINQESVINKEQLALTCQQLSASFLEANEKSKDQDKVKINQFLLSILDTTNEFSFGAGTVGIELPQVSPKLVKLAMTERSLQVMFLLLNKICDVLLEDSKALIITGIPNKELAINLRQVSSCSYDSNNLNILYIYLVDINCRLLVHLSSLSAQYVSGAPNENSLMLNTLFFLEAYLPQNSTTCPVALKALASFKEKLESRVSAKSLQSFEHIFLQSLKNQTQYTPSQADFMRTSAKHLHPKGFLHDSSPSVQQRNLQDHATFTDKINKALGPKFVEAAKKGDLWWECNAEGLLLGGQAFPKASDPDKNYKGKRAIITRLEILGIKEKNINFVEAKYNPNAYTIQLSNVSHLYTEHFTNAMKTMGL